MFLNYGFKLWVSTKWRGMIERLPKEVDRGSSEGCEGWCCLYLESKMRKWGHYGPHSV